MENRSYSETATYNITHRLPEFNRYSGLERKSKYAGASMKKQYTLLCNVACRCIRGEIDPAGRYDVHLLWTVTDNKIDPDGVFFGIKFILDGLVEAGVVNNDGRKNIRNIHHDIETSKKYNVQVTLTKCK